MSPIFARALEQDGFFLRRTTGSHHICRHPDGRTIPVPYSNPSDGFAIGTLRRMIELAKWTDDDLRRLKLIK
jgi:predicted RNA binding protein YcfA (HicA-like mRNA interferase family)